MYRSNNKTSVRHRRLTFLFRIERPLPDLLLHDVEEPLLAFYFLLPRHRCTSLVS